MRSTKHCSFSGEDTSLRNSERVFDSPTVLQICSYTVGGAAITLDTLLRRVKMAANDPEYQSRYSKMHYAKYKEKYIRKARNHAANAQALIRSLKIKCARCPETFHRCLDFHHLGDKEFNLGQAVRWGYSLERIKREAEKCIILCANCHRKETYKDEFALVA